MNSLLSINNLKACLKDENLIILDASQSNKEATQIKGARTFDIKTQFSAEGDFPNTFPTKEQFEKGCQQLGINKDSKLVVYDNKGIFSSPRVWWMFKIFGHNDIAVLNGGLPEWIKQKGETELVKDKEYQSGDFEATLQPNQVEFIEDIKLNILSDECLLVDARSIARFNSEVAESRDGLRSGNIPKSENLPFSDLLNNGKFKSTNELKEIFNPFEKKEKPFIFTCGTGITACILLLGYQLAYNKSGTIYDGSWTEWGTLVSE